MPATTSSTALRILREQLGALGLELGERDHPVAVLRVGRAVDQDRASSSFGISALCARSFVDLARVLDEHVARVGVGEDERALLGGARRIDRRRRAAGATGCRGRTSSHSTRVFAEDADALLAMEAEREQARRDRLDALAGLAPGHRAPVARRPDSDRPRDRASAATRCANSCAIDVVLRVSFSGAIDSGMAGRICRNSIAMGSAVRSGA